MAAGAGTASALLTYSLSLPARWFFAAPRTSGANEFRKTRGVIGTSRCLGAMAALAQPCSPSGRNMLTPAQGWRPVITRLVRQDPPGRRLTSSTGAFNAELRQDCHHRAPVGDRRLQQVQAYEGGEQQPIGRMVVGQQNTQNHEEACDSPQQSLNGHKAIFSNIHSVWRSSRCSTAVARRTFVAHGVFSRSTPAGVLLLSFAQAQRAESASSTGAMWPAGV
jgi:hypothetical protein